MDTPQQGEQPDSYGRRKYALTALKAAVAAAVLGFLFWQARQAEVFDQLVKQPKNWWLLATALTLTVACVLISFVRWALIARAAELSLTPGEAVRIGALSFALNFVSPGSVGGDVYKAIAVARGRPGQRTRAVTTVAVDRIMGLLSKMIVASAAYVALLLAGASMAAEVRIVCLWLLLATAVGMLVAALAMVPGAAGRWFAGHARELPLAGELLGSVLDAGVIYRRNLRLLAGAVGLCLMIDFLFVGSFYCVATGLPFHPPSFVHHLLMVPFALTAGAIPVMPGGLGTREAVIEAFYQGFGIAAWQGGLIAFGHSLTLLTAGGIATVYYLAHRARVRANLAPSEQVATAKSEIDAA